MQADALRDVLQVVTADTPIKAKITINYFNKGPHIIFMDVASAEVTAGGGELSSVMLHCTVEAYEL